MPKQKKRLKNKNIILSSTALLTSIIVGVVLGLLGSIAKDVLAATVAVDFGPSVLTQIYGGLVVFVIFGVFLALALYFFSIPKSFFIFMMYCLLFFIFLGFVFIHEVYGEQIIDLPLYHEGAVAGSITCPDSHTVLIANQTVVCHFSPRLVNYTYEVHFSGEQEPPEPFRSAIIRDYEWLAFTLPPNADGIFFTMEGIAPSGELVRFTSQERVYPIRAYSKSEYDQRYNTRVAFYLGVLGLAFFSVPVFFLNLRKLWNEE